MCKHIHLASMEAERRRKQTWVGHHPTEARLIRATSLFDGGMFEVSEDKRFLFVYDGDAVNTVCMESRKCFCVASSHLQECICSIVFQLYKDSITPDTVSTSVPAVASPQTTEDSRADAIEQPVVPVYDRSKKAQEQLKKMLTFLQNGSDCSVAAGQKINAAYCQMFQSFKGGGRLGGRRKAQTDSSFKSRLSKKHKDHGYTASSAPFSYYRPDGAAKTKGHRRKGASRSMPY